MAGDLKTLAQQPARPSSAAGPPLAAVAEAVSRMRYGVVQLTVHDGKVVQLDVTERQRFT
ncbi:uncharacterized protein DUF2292 [Novosphingobium kunmingense]|uniref:Uncharacterized protein DUF2292 n=1 Tax=Novosphingobium kunmingense TaxID=1211806 RepID=A0A2N0I3J6_9SPHN|nr:YezD family protein [Novosphingobium kunmingense]PKB25762.1 uncharacterized protein DUF2292 [Novosphingobium kunmingense]